MSGWKFDNSYLTLPEVFYSITDLNPVSQPRLLVFNDKLATELGISSDKEVLQVLAGNKKPLGAASLAMAYAGHQFGNFTMLGDGRALLIGEQITQMGHRFDIQLKGSGKTAYSRGGDGRAAIGPMLREYIISEAMHALGIPTTRSLAVVATGEIVTREHELPGAILTRVASSHLRVGTFEFAAIFAEPTDLKALADYAIRRHEPEIGLGKSETYLAFYQRVLERQATLMAHWMSVGFVHGVMNTDNMAISGETIDYGPCAFIDSFDLTSVYSSIDKQGRYAFGQQLHIAPWNLTRLAETLLPLLDQDRPNAIQKATLILEAFPKYFYNDYRRIMSEKIGIANGTDQDFALVENLLQIMADKKYNYHHVFRALTYSQFRSELEAFIQDADFSVWHNQWTDRLSQLSDSEGIGLMKSKNPLIYPQNHLLEKALSEASDNRDLKLFNRLLLALQNPFTYRTEDEDLYHFQADSGRRFKTFCGT